VSRLGKHRREILRFEFDLSTLCRDHKIMHTQLLGCVPWDQVSHEHNSSSISGFFVYGEHSRGVL
jgi:hypothetical protein